MRVSDVTDKDQIYRACETSGQKCHCRAKNVVCETVVHLANMAIENNINYETAAAIARCIRESNIEWGGPIHIYVDDKLMKASWVGI